MRKDSINQEAIEKALLIYAERGHQTLDFSHTPTDYKKGTVEEPNHVSNIDGRYAEILPAGGSRESKFDALRNQSESLEEEIETVQDQMRVSRERGAFQQLQAQMKKVNQLVKEKEAVDAKMATTDLSRAQLANYGKEENQESDYAERLDEIGSRIAEIEKMMLQFSEMNK
jgi:chaperonin cofactor prefoldin